METIRLGNIAAASIALLIFTAAAPSLPAQILYVQPDNNGFGHLRQMNADGTGDQAADIPVLDVAVPVWPPMERSLP